MNFYSQTNIARSDETTPSKLSSSPSLLLRITDIAKSLDLEQLQHVYQRLLVICRDADSPWQSVDGAALGITMLIRRVSWLIAAPNALLAPRSKVTPGRTLTLLNWLNPLFFSASVCVGHQVGL